MRLTNLLVLSFFVTACNAASAEPTADRADTTTCSASVGQYCRTSGCDRTLAAAEHDPQLCAPGFPAVEYSCGGYQVVSKSEIDTIRSYYYKNGRLVAIEAHVVGAQFSTCIAGPKHFEAPQCDPGQGTVLPECSATP